MSIREILDAVSGFWQLLSEGFWWLLPWLLDQMNACEDATRKAVAKRQ